MKKAVKKMRRWKKIIAWMLTAAIVAGNVSELSVTTAYASELLGGGQGREGSASPSEAGRSEDSKDMKQIDVKVTESAIKKALKRNFDDRLELKEDLIPFQGEQKELVLQMLYEELGDKTLVLQKKTGKAMYMVVISNGMEDEPFFDSDSSERIKQDSLLENIQIIAVNGYEDKDCEFKLQIISEDLTITEAKVDEYLVLGVNSQEEEEIPESEEGLFPEETEAPEAPVSGGGSAGGGSSSGPKTEEPDKSSEAGSIDDNKNQGADSGKPDGEAPAESENQSSENQSDSEKEASDSGDSKDHNSSSDKIENGDSTSNSSENGESGKNDSSNDNTGSGESGKSDASSDKTGSGDTKKSDSANDKTGSGDTGKSDVSSDKTGSGDTGKSDSPNDKTGSGDSGNSNSSGNSSGSGNSGKSDSSSGKTGSGDSGNSNSSGNNSGSGNSGKSDASSDKSGSGNSGNSDSSNDKSGGSDKGSGQKVSMVPTGTKSLTLVKHEVPVLFSPETATPSIAINPEDFEEPEVVLVSSERSLADQELAALMGTTVEEMNGEEGNARLFSMKEKPSYSLRVPSMGISVLSTELNGEEEKPSPYEVAQTYYGNNATNPKEVVEFDLSQSQTGEIEAGKGFNYTLTYTMQAAPLYEYTAGGKLALFDLYENAGIQFTVPAGIVLEEQEGKVSLSSVNDDGSRVYAISVGEDGAIQPGTSDHVVIKANIDGNGERGVGEAFELTQDCAAFHAEVKVADKTDKNNIEYPGNIETLTYANQSGVGSLTLVSPDEWHIAKNVYPSDGNYTVVNDESGNPEFVEIQYLIEVGMYGKSSQTISTDLGGTVYQRYGRTGFEANSFKIKDTLEIMTPKAPDGMKPIAVTAAWGDGSTISYHDGIVDGLIITDYKTRGNDNQDGHVEVSDQAPVYSSYLVTARYPYEPFVLSYNDPRINDKDVFTIKNTAELQYVKLGTSEIKTEKADASVAVHEVNKPAVIKIKKMVDEGTGGAGAYDKSMEKEYPGLARFQIYSLNGGEKTEYKNYTVINSNGARLDREEIVINPSNDESETAKGYYTTGNDGYIQIQVDPGTYIIEETQMPTGTEYQSASVGTSRFSKDEAVTVEVKASAASGETREVTIVNAVVGKGTIEFYKKARTWDSSGKTDSELSNLEGAVFGLYEKKSEGLVEIKTALSDGNGLVQFKPVTPGEYVIKEISAEGYIVDTEKEYPVTVLKDQTAKLTDENFVVNTSNQARVNVTKWIQKNDETYIKTPKNYRADFKDRFTLEQSADGITWSKAAALDSSAKTYSLNNDSSFQATLRVYDNKGQKIKYRVAEKVPDGYKDGNEADGTVTTELKNGVTYIYKTFELEPLKTAQVDLRNKKGGTLKLKKTVWALTASGNINKNAPKKNYKFKLYTLEDGVYKEVSENKIYTTNNNGLITVKGLDLSKDYYWCELNGNGTSLEDEQGRYFTAEINGISQTLIGPYRVNRETDTVANAYNVPQSLPYWIYKVDAIDETKDIKATFQITDETTGTVLYPNWPYFEVTKEGRMITLEPGKTYAVEELSASYGYEVGGIYKISTPAGPITRKVLEEWVKDKKKNQLKIKNKPYQTVTIKKSAVNQYNGQIAENAVKSFEVYVKTEGVFQQVGNPILSSKPETLAPGEYYFKEVIKDNVLNPYYLLNKNGEEGVYEVVGQEVYFGPFTVKAAATKEEQNQDIYLLKDNKALVNYQDYGRVSVTKTDALRGSGVTKAKIGIFRADQFNPDDWGSNVPIEVKETNWSNGKTIARFESPELKIFNEDGSRIEYIIAEVEAPAGYLQSYDILRTTLKEGEVITTAYGLNGEDLGTVLEIKNEPKLTIRTQKFWQDSWNNQFYPVNHVLGDVELALYKVNEDQSTASLITTARTNSYDGIAAFTDINRNDTYYVVEVEAPEGLTMNGKAPLPKTEQGIPLTVLVDDLETIYNSVSFTGKGIAANDKNLVRNTEALYNYKDWVQFNILKTCDGLGVIGSAKEEDHQKEPINGARFILYMQLEDFGADLSGITPEALLNGSSFKRIDAYESGTRLDAKGQRVDGEFDTTILEPGRVYWLVEEEGAPDYRAEGMAPKIVAVFVPEGSGYTYTEGLLKSYQSGRNDQIAVIENPHTAGGEGYGAYHFQIALNKWLKDLEKPNDGLTLLGGAKFQIWLVHPDTKEKLLPIQVVETGLESKGEEKTGYALSDTINMGKLREKLADKYSEEEIDKIIRLDENENVLADFALEEIFAPSKVTMDGTLHYLTAVIPKGSDHIDRTCFWEETENPDSSHRLINTVSKEYPVKLVKYGYEPNSDTFGKTDDELSGQSIERTPLSGVKLEVQKEQWNGSKYEWKTIGTYTTEEDGAVQLLNGLAAGHYRLKEALTATQEKEYLTVYTGNGSLWRYFTVGSAPVTVNIFNPEKPDLEIEKQTWGNESLEGLEGITFNMELNGKSFTSSPVKKQADGRFTASFENLDSGKYTIIQENLNSAAKDFVTSNYFAVQAGYVGYSVKADGERVYLEPYKPEVSGKVQKVVIRNPRLSGLTIEKTDENSLSGEAMKGAEFTVEYQTFRAGTDWNIIYGILNPEVLSDHYEKPETGFNPIAKAFRDNGDGTYSMSQCAPGWYKITEMKAPQGYALASQPMIIAVTGDMLGTYDETAKEAFVNKKKAELTVTKRLDFGDFKNEEAIAQRLPEEIVFDIYTWENNAYQQVMDENNKEVQIKLQNFEASDGYYSSSGTALLPQEPTGGYYYLKEQDTKDWAYPRDGVVTGGTLQTDGYIQIGSGFASREPVNLTAANLYARTGISLKKTDKEDPDKKLTGAVFELYADASLTSKVGDFKETEEQGVYAIEFSTKEYQPGTYFIKEVGAPAGYIPITTDIPAEGIEAGKIINLEVTNQGGVDFHIRKFSGNGNGEETHKSGIEFELYRKSGNGSWNYIASGITDSNGEVSFKGLKLPAGDSYAAYEVPNPENGMNTYEMASFENQNGEAITPTVADAVKPGEDRTAIDLYVLTGDTVEAPGVYQFEAHNQEALPLKLVKNDVNKSDNPTGLTVTMRITDKNTKKQVGDLISVPYGDTGAVVKLLPGAYEIEEVSVSQNDNGYVINRDDIRTVYKKEVVIEKGRTPEPCEFTNVKQNTGLTLYKSTDAKALKDLWWNDGQSITYTLTPEVINTVPLDRFVLTDTGLEMLDSGKSTLPAEEYTNEKYTITSVKPGSATEQNQIRDARTGTILADITFYDFNGNQTGQVLTVPVSGGGEISPVLPSGGNNVKSFSISYHDDTLKDSTENRYALGQNFVPGTIEVTVKLHQQSARLSDGSYKKEIKYIRNRAEIKMDFRKWDINGALTEVSADSKAEAQCDISTVQSQAPTIAVNKSVSPDGNVKVGDKLNYTLSVKNTTNSDDTAIVPFKEPVLIDHVPLGVTVSGVTEGEDRLLGAVKLKSAPDGVSIEKTLKKVDQETGQETIYIKLSGELKKDESAVIEMEASLAGNIINYDKNILNKLYVTSNVLQPAFSLNKTGASFMISSSSGDKWPSADLPDEVLLPDESLRDYGYASSSAQNYMNTGTGLVLYKEVKGNLDSRFVSGTTVGKVAKSANDGDMENKYDGTVNYRLTVNNASASDYVTELQLMDIMPVPGDYSTGNIRRLSDFKLKYQDILSIAIENINKDEPSGRKLSDFSYDLTATKRVFDEKDTAAEARESMKNHNSDGFWSGLMEDPTAIRIEITDPDFYLAPGENLVVTYKTAVPYETMKELNEAAYSYAVNDFATSYSYKNSLQAPEETQFTQIQTSNTVQVLLVPGNVKVSGRIWIDDNNNGIQDESVENDHLLTDLYPVLAGGYFNIGLEKQSKSDSEVVTGKIGLKDARFLFDELIPAKPDGVDGDSFSKAQESSWYDKGGRLNVSKLKGEDPAHYQIYVNAGTMPEGFEDLILKLAKPTMTESGEKNKEAGRSRLPESLLSDGENYKESLDSNFNGAAGSYTSEDFFLWSTAGYDKTKDIGFVPFRNVVVKKVNNAGNPVENAHFSVYGPFTNDQITEWQKGQTGDISVLGEPLNSGYTAIHGKDAVWNAGELLYYGNYILVEDGAPTGYQIKDAQSADMSQMDSFSGNGHKAWLLKSKEFKNENDKIPSTVTVIDQYISGSLEFTKVDGLTGEGLKGAGFKLEKKEDVIGDAWNAFTKAMKDNADASGISNVRAGKDEVEFEVASESGLAVLKNIPYGTYSFSEITVPEGYDITDKPEQVEFKIETDGQQVELQGYEGNIIKNNRTEYSLSLKKVDNTGNDKVSGIGFTITGPGKYEDSSWNPFAKASFKLNNPDQSGFDKQVTDSGGLIKWNLPYGDYEIRESETAGYESIKPFYVRIDGNGSVSLLNAEDRKELELTSSQQNQINVTVTNKIKTGSLTIEKVDGENQKAITGAVFELSGDSAIAGAFAAYLGNVTGRGVTDVTAGNQDQTLWLRFRLDGSGTDGMAILTQIPYGSYTLKEVEAPAGYLFTGEGQWTKEITIDSENGVSLTGENAVKNTPHELIIEKQDKANLAMLEGAVFTLKTADGSYVVLDESNSYTGLTSSSAEASSFVTGADGRVTVKRLPAGNYILIEKEAPANYGVSSDTEISVLQSGNVDAVKVYDERTMAKITLTKTAAHDKSQKLSGAVFEIYSDKELTALAGTMTTGSRGSAESIMLPLGTYYVKEKSAPAGYELSQRVYEVTLGKDKEAYPLTADGNDYVANEYSTGSLSFEKQDSLSGENLSLAEFALIKKETKIQGAWESFTALLEGKSQSELESMGIGGVKATEHEVRFMALDGHVALEGIPYGTYTLKETKAPKGYLSLVNNWEFSFTLSEDQREAVAGENGIIHNSRADFELQLKKVDDLGRAISGIGFEITGPGVYQDGFLAGVTGNKLKTGKQPETGTLTTGDDGLIQLGLKHGDYQLKELSTDRFEAIEPFFIRIDEEGAVSILEDKSSAVTVTDSGLITLKVTNKISTGSLELEKADSEDKAKQLNGAEFTLTALDTEVPGAWESYRSLVTSYGAAWSADDVKGNTITFVLNGKGLITNLPYGTYRLTETKAPDGYILGSEPWSREFTINRVKREALFITKTLFQTTEGPIENNPSKITVKKTNAVYADLKLAGAEFILRSEDGRYITLEKGYFTGYTAKEADASRFVTDEEGEFVIKKLPSGTYQLIETKAPEGYKINHEIPPVTLDGVHSFTVTIQDEIISGNGENGGHGGNGGGSGSHVTDSTKGDSGRGPGTNPDDLVTILPDDVPLANLPTDATSDLLLVIDDGEVPLARLPKTGDKKSSAGKMMVAVSGFMLALYAALSKKKKENQK